MIRAGNALFDPLQPWSPDVSNEVTYLSGIDGVGAASTQCFWAGYQFGYGMLAGSYPWAHKWGPAPGAAFAASAGGVVDFSFAPGWSTTDENTVLAGLALWSAVANIQFQQVAYSPNPAQQSPLIFYYSADGAEVTGTYYAATAPASTYGTPGLGQTTGTAVWFDPPQLNIGGLSSFTAYGGYGIDTVVHELGHVLGLGHAGPYNGTVNTMTQQYGPYDSRQWSIMSYINPWDAARYSAEYPVTGTNWGVGADGYYREPTTWMPLDILAAQRLYGVATNTPLYGGQVFGFHCNIGGAIQPFFDFTVNTAPVVTLWDAGLGNTLDVSGFSQPAFVDLRPGTFSSVDGMTNNVGIAYGTSIDTAIGGPGATTFVVNSQSDSIVGNGPANTVIVPLGGGNFHDVYAGPARILSGSGVSDTLVGVGSLAFVGGADTISSNVGGAVTLAGGHNALFLGGVMAQVTLGGADTLIATTGYTRVTAAGAQGAAGDFVFGNSGGLVFQGGATRDTVVGAAVTVTGGSAGLTVYGEGNLVGQGGDGYSVFASFGASSETVQAGAGGGLLVGGMAGNNRLVANGGAAVIFGNGNGDLITLQNAVQDVVVMGGGTETVNATGSGAGDVIYAGTGNDLLLGGPGDFMAPGSGNDTLNLGGGTNGLLFINGRVGGTDVIDNWDPSHDYLFLIGYGAAADQQAAASQVQSGGNTLVTLADHTQIWFMGVHGVGASSFA